MTGKIKIFYHIFCNEKTFAVVKDQVTKIIFSGLYDRANDIYCFIAGLEEERVKEIAQYLEQSGSKFHVCETSTTDTSYERFTLTKICNYIDPEDKILYIHTKGITKSGEVENHCHDWRTFMEYHLIYRHQECLHRLKSFDTVGVNLERIPALHYSGNFWWARGSYYMQLNPDVLNQNFWGSTYLAPEMYILSGNARMLEINRSMAKNHYQESYPFMRYID